MEAPAKHEGMFSEGKVIGIFQTGYGTVKADFYGDRTLESFKAFKLFLRAGAPEQSALDLAFHN